MVNKFRLLFVTKVCSHLRNPFGGVMRSVTVRICAAKFSATMTAIGEWLDANRHKPTRYKYDHDEDAVLLTVDFSEEVAARMFATHFDGVYRLSPRATSQI